MSLPKDNIRKGRLVRISGSMLGAKKVENNKETYTAIPSKSLICVDISTCDPYPYAPARVWHPKYGKMWYIDDGFSQYEWLDDNQNISHLKNAGTGSVVNSSR